MSTLFSGFHFTYEYEMTIIINQILLSDVPGALLIHKQNILYFLRDRSLVYLFIFFNCVHNLPFEFDDNFIFPKLVCRSFNRFSTWTESLVCGCRSVGVSLLSPMQCEINHTLTQLSFTL